MRSRSLCITAAVSISAVATHTTVYAQSKTIAADKIVSDIAMSGTKFGITAVRGVILSESGARYVAPPEQGLAGKAIEEVVNSYSTRKARTQGEITLVQGTVDRMADLAAITTTIATGGTGAVPIAMVRAAVQAGTDDYFGSARKQADETMRVFLAKSQTKIVKDAGLSYEELRLLPPEQIRDLLDKGTRTFKDLDQRISDPEVRQFARDLAVSSIINTQKSTLDQLGQQNAQVVDMKGKLGRLEHAYQELGSFTISTLEKQERSITTLNTAVVRLDDTVSRIDQRLAVQERNTEFVQDFMFDKMDPAKKAEALKSGFMSMRFICTDGGSECEQAKLKADLIDRFETEALIQKTIESAGTVVRDANNLLKIASDLGIKTGPAADIVAYGTVAFNAFASVASGNYIGAIASITGAFGGKGPDPQLVYMREQFEKINKTLNVILDNQRKLSEQVAQLSDRLDMHVEQLNARFDVIEARVARVRQLQAMTNNAAWQPCFALYNYAVNAENVAHFKIDFATSSFPSVELASSFARSYSTALEGCTVVVDSRTLSLTSPDWFGNFLNVTTNVVNQESELDQIENDRNAVWRVVSDYLLRSKTPTWRAYQMYASPAESLDALRARVIATPPGPACGTTGALAKDRLSSLLCITSPATSPAPSDAAANGLSVSMIPTHAIEVAGWILIEQALVDVHAVRRTGDLVTGMELVRYNPKGSPRSIGEDHTEKALLLLDAAMANTSMLHGDLTVEAVLTQLTSKQEADATLEADRKKRLADVRASLSLHPYLARNVGMALLKDRLGIYNDDEPTGVAPVEAYRKALQFAEEAEGDEPFTFFETLFGKGLSFVRSDKKKVFLVIFPQDPGGAAVLAPMPEPLAFAAGRFFYPNQVQQLVDARAQVGVRILDYQALRGLNPLRMQAVIRTLARAEQTK